MHVPTAQAISPTHQAQTRSIRLPVSVRFTYLPPVLSLQGPGCSAVSTVVTVMAAVFNLVTMSPSAGNALLSSKVEYPYFLRTTAPHTVWVPAAVELCKHFRWSRVAAIAEVAPVPLGTMSAFVQNAANAGIEVVVGKQLEWGSDYFKTIHETLNAITFADARIIVIYALAAFMRQFFCDASRRGLVGSKYVYMLPGRERGSGGKLGG